MSERFVELERLLDASPSRVYRAWSDPDALTGWFAPDVEGSLAPGARSTLMWPDRSLWIDVLEAEPDRRFRFRWAWLEGDDITTEVRVDLEPRGYGTRLVLRDGPFELDRQGGLDAWAEAIEGWAESLANLRAQLDFSVDLRRLRGRAGAGPR